MRFQDAAKINPSHLQVVYNIFLSYKQKKIKKKEDKSIVSSCLTHFTGRIQNKELNIECN